MKRIIAAIIALLMIMPAVVSCSEPVEDGSQKNADTGSGADISDIEETDAETDRTQIKDGVPDGLNFDGAKFTILDRNNTGAVEHDCPELDGEVVNDAIYARNMKLEERLNVEYSVVCVSSWNDYDKTQAAIRASVNSDDDAYQMVNGYSVNVTGLAAEGLFLDLRPLEYIDLNQIWWRELVNRELYINGRQYFATGDINITTMSSSDVFFANKTTMSNYGVTDVYSLVREGSWTFDGFMDIVKGIYEDVNGNGKYDDNDIYGAAFTTYNSMDGMFGAFHQNVTEFNDEGNPVLFTNPERIVDIVGKLYNMLYETEGVHACTKIIDDAGTMFAMFKNDRAVFCAFMLGSVEGYLRDMDSDYCILPYPKYDEQQDGYGVYLQDGHSLICVPITARDTEMVSACIETLAAEGYRTVFPAFYDNTLSYKYARDEESIEMLDIIRSSLWYNFGYVYNVDLVYIPRTLLNQSSPNTASYIERHVKSWTRALDKIMERFNSIDG